MFSTYRQLLTCAILFGFTIASASSQEVTGTISGVVSDETGGVLPSVEVTARNTGTEATRTAISDDEGRYRLSQLPPGDYEVRAALVGFRTAVLQDISLSVGQEAVIGITLRVGAISEQVVVSAEVALVDTTSGSVANLVDNEQVRRLPLNGRDFIELAALQEGVVTPLSARRTVNGDTGLKMNIAGARSTENAILLDGTDIKNQYGTTPGSVSGKLLGVDTFREMRVITSAYTAEYGRFSGGVISAVTKSGTNEFHGTIFEFFRNSALDARNYFDRDFVNPVPRSDPPNFIRNQFGFTVGGPIIKDRTFFFGSYEGLRDRLTTTDISNFPNELAHQGLIPFRFRGVPQCPPSERVGNFCQIDINPQVQPYIDLYPIPQGPDQGDGIAQFFFDNPQPINEDFFVIKIDHQLSESDSLYGRYTFDEAKLDFLTEAFIMGLTETNRNQYVTLEERHIFSPNLLNEIRVAFNRSHSKTDDFPNNGFEVDRDLWFNPLFPAEVGGEYYGGMGLFLCRGCGINQFGTTTRTPQKHTLNNYQLMDNVVWTRGRHSLKLGFSWSRFQYNYQNIARSQGSFQYENLQELLRGFWQESTIYYGGLEDQSKMVAGLRQNLFGFYIQDDWAFRPNLTFNLGLRYEFITSPNEVSGRFGNLQNSLQPKTITGNPYFENPSLKNFSPRIGFAWDPTGSGKFSVRGGFGLFYDQVLQWCCTSSVFRSTPFGIRALLEEGVHGAIPVIGETEEAYRARSAIVCPDCEGNYLNSPFTESLILLNEDHPAVEKPAMFAVSDPDQPYLMQWSLTVEREILPNTALTLGYSGSRGVHIPQGTETNRPIAQQTPEGEYFYECNFVASGQCFTDRENPNFTAITDRVWDRNSFYNAFKLGLMRRFTSGLSFQVSYQFQKSIDEGGTIAGSPRETVNDQWLGSNWLDRKTDRGLSNFNVPNVFSVNYVWDLPFGGGASGFTGTLIKGWSVSGILNLFDGSPQNIEGGARVTCTTGCSNIRPSLIPGGDNSPNTGDPEAWFGEVEGNFEVQAPGTFGDLGRNTAYGPGAAFFDLGVQKRFAMGDRAELQFRAEFFNIFNRTNFQGPIRTRSAFQSTGSVNSSFGEITQTATTSRNIQFALKITF